MTKFGVKLNAIMLVALAICLAACSTDRENDQVSSQQWREYMAAGPVPERAVGQRPLDKSSAQAKQILFGDTHVHTTFSLDAFSRNVPMSWATLGAFVPADACDYARYISQIDFFFLTDHAKAYTPETWEQAKQTIRDCNAVAGDAQNPDLVAYMGYEWTQVAGDPDAHYGHHNVLYRDIEDERLPPRPVASLRLEPGTQVRQTIKPLPALMQWLDFPNRDFYRQYNSFVTRAAGIPLCEQGVPTRDLPKECLEIATTPRDLYRKLAEFGEETVVIPHGMAWGHSAPPGASWDHYMDSGQVNNKIVRLLELYSGHGNSEEYRDFESRRVAADETVSCPPVTAQFLPSCQRAGQLIEQWCLAEGESAAECEARAARARQYFVDVPSQLGWLVVPGSTPSDWLDAGQCRDCFAPAFNYRPKKSAQYALARTSFAQHEGDKRFRWGFVGSTDTHRGAAGNGYKQSRRLYVSDADGPMSDFYYWLFNRNRGDREAMPRQVDIELAKTLGPAARDQERLTSFLTLGGLAAVHAQGRDREAIWEALKRRETYATSGHRILLWFDAHSAAGSTPMGGALEGDAAPQFEVRAVGSYKQLDGCPATVVAAVGEDKLHRLGLGECYNPSDERWKIERIEVVKIRPQVNAGEPIQGLIEDVWRSFPCDDTGEGCRVSFTDEAFAAEQRDALYYVRAIEEASPMVNGANLRTTFNDMGDAVAIDPCYGDYRVAADDDCVAPVGQRAWSSPIYVDYRSEPQP